MIDAAFFAKADVKLDGVRRYRIVASDPVAVLYLVGTDIEVLLTQLRCIQRAFLAVVL